MSATENGEENGDGGDQLLAAEYVLGVLSARDREKVLMRAERDPAFARLIEEWEKHFSPIAGAYDPIDPPAAIKEALDRRLFSGTALDLADESNWWTSLAFWRASTAGAVTALLILFAAPYLSEPSGSNRLVASLAGDATDVRYLALYDGEHGEVGLSHLSGERETGRDFELWVIEADASPVSMGVVPGGSSVRIELSEELRRKLAAGATLAITMEPEGGSPSGKPTGPVVAAGNLTDI